VVGILLLIVIQPLVTKFCL